MENAGREAAVPPESTRKQEIRREVFELVKMVMLFLVLFWGLKSFVIEGYEVQGPSMVPKLEDRQRILVFKLPHQLRRIPVFSGLNAIEAGDIVVFDSKEEADKRYIKRVIAKGPNRVPGKTVDAKAHDDLTPKSDWVQVEYDHGTVYVNNHRLEESYLRPEEANSAGTDKVVLEDGEYYVLGDHRSVSKDSRSFGPIKDERIIGRALLRFWPPNKISLL